MTPRQIPTPPACPQIVEHEARYGTRDRHAEMDADALRFKWSIGLLAAFGIFDMMWQLGAAS